MDPSGLSGGDRASGEPAQTEVNIGMKPDYYYGAERGVIEVFKDILEPLDQLLTPNRNTVLHIHLASQNKRSEDSYFVEEILTKCPTLLWQANVKGETPLHIAARYGHDAIAEVLIKCAKSPQHDPESGVNKTVKEMLEMTNNEKDTALHEAVRNNHLDVVQRLIQEGPKFSYSQNEAGETPLYIAVERGFKEVMYHILDKCSSPTHHDGPLGRTTLHAAVIWNDDEMIQKILERIAQQEQSAFIKKVDKQRWTPLHCAAYFGHCNIARLLLEVDRSIAYMKDAKGMTALHIAAHQGHRWVMEFILEDCPDCCELVDERGWNALHFVVNSSSSCWAKREVKDILEKSSFSNLLNEKDADGNTPLHHHSKSLHYIKDVMCHNRVDKMAFNKQNFNAYDIALTSEVSAKKFMQITRAYIDNGLRPEFRRPLEDDILLKGKDYADNWGRLKAWKSRKDQFVSSMEKASKTHLVVDTLIATVAFTAGITMPGGFRDHEGPHPGSAVLMGNAAFKAFVITNTLAMVQSCSAAFIHLFMPLLFHDKNLIGDFSFLLASLAFCLSISAMGAMMLAFVTGTYAVLMHSLNLAIANSVIGLCFFIPLFFVSIGCSQYLHEMWSIGLSWFFEYVLEYVLFFLLGICCFLLWIGCLLPFICYFLCGLCYVALKDLSLRLRRSRRSRNDADQSTAS
ncbi:ankyrin repeat-containing protein At5g02620-like [Quercus lobata]|uniref:ankyrin repeat-containing protein At5g02620-like n=1 Tax=Quercus lobata TaxID=97700 RepID=UPI001247AAB5|nr:ankyrin repeat-containing protein At5g02620-like [Quercus lobata]